MPYISAVQAQKFGHQLHQTYAAVGVSVEDATPVVAWILRDNINFVNTEVQNKAIKDNDIWNVMPDADSGHRQ